MYETNAIGLDISHYDHNIDAAQLKGNVDFLIIKAGGSETGQIYIDPRFAERVQMAYDIGVPAMAYWFVGPQYWLNNQYTLEKVTSLSDAKHPILQKILYQLKNKLIYSLFFDVENASVALGEKTVPEAWVSLYISDLVKRLRGKMRSGVLREMKLGVYSRKSFIEDPANRQKSLEAYLGTQADLAIWTANWVTGTGATLPMSQIYQLRPTHKPLTYGYCPDRPAEWQFWQWSGDVGRVYKTPGITNASGLARGIDIDLFNGTPAQLRAWLGVGAAQPEPEPTPEPEPEPEPGPVDLSEVTARLDRVLAKQDEILARLERLAWLERE
jgi:GH25 family lysozyme M1 (1,4-beta-N-acetylmuramidase)